MSQPHPGNLPVETTGLVGRRQELAEAARALRTARMLTLTGVGGVGKTRLALRMAAEQRERFPDGVWLVDLAPLVAGEVIAQAVAQAVGLQGRSDAATLGAYLAPRRLLLILDGCERRRDDCADLAGLLLRAAPDLRILATSQQRLGLREEHTLEVPPLPVPETDEAMSAEAAGRYAAVELFAERAAAAVLGFTVDDANAPAVLRLCQRLDGVPLAIELAAVRLRALSVEQIAERLDDRFRLLTGGSPAAGRHQRNLRALVDWSHDLCLPVERTMWERLSVFAGGFTLEAAKAVCAGDGLAAGRIPAAVAGLVDKSIVRRKEQEDGPRYLMLETIRQYGRDRLAESDGQIALRRRHRDWCRELAAQAEAGWFGARQLEWATRLRQEQSNVCAALEFCLSEPGEARHALEIAASIWGHRLSWISVRDGHRWLARALSLDTAPSSARAKALWVDAWLRLLCGEADAAASLLEESRLIAERLDDRGQLAGVAHVRGYAALLAGDFRRATRLLETAVARRRADGDHGAAVTSLIGLATTAVFGRDPRSAALCAECRDACERANARWSMSYALWTTGLDRWWCGDTSAEKLITDALRLAVPYHDHLEVAQCVEALSWIAADTRRYGRAAELLGAAHMLWRSIGTSLPGVGHLAAPHDRAAARLHRALGDRAFTASYLRGARLTVDGAIALALDERAVDGAPRPVASAADTRVLTRRERQIAELVARGMSNRQIAETLVISQRTAEGHVEHILRKLGLGSRAEVAAAWTGDQEAASSPTAPGPTASGPTASGPATPR